jgi:hypothetical protein
MTKEELAKELDGRMVGSEIDYDEKKAAKESGLVVIFGAGDDLSEFAGAICDEVDCFDGAVVRLHDKGVVESHDECECKFCGYNEIAEKCPTLEILWCQTDEYSWTYKTDLPHATFDIMDDEGDDRKYCRGIVIDVRDLPSL